MCSVQFVGGFAKMYITVMQCCHCTSRINWSDWPGDFWVILELQKQNFTFQKGKVMSSNMSSELDLH